MNQLDLQKYIHSNIPLTKAMGITVQEATKHRVILEAPLEPNMNHKKTAFGGSLHSLATLSCWSLVFMNLKDKNIPVEIVISKSEIKYLAPVTNNFKVECHLQNKEKFSHFEQTLAKHGKARIRLNAQIYEGNTLAVDYWGEFAVLRA